MDILFKDAGTVLNMTKDILLKYVTTGKWPNYHERWNFYLNMLAQKNNMIDILLKGKYRI